MVSIEALFPTYDQARRDFLFAGRGRSGGRQPTRRPRGETPLAQPEPPRWNPQLTRRVLIFGGAAAGGLSIAAAILKPWELFSSPETLESLVAQAKRMEDEYRGKSLSERATREKYVDILAGIFAFHYPEYLSRRQLKEAVDWADNLDQFVRQRITSSGKTGQPTAQQLENERFTTASTYNRARKITVNVASEAFKQENIALLKNAPPSWNPLKMLRISLLHEFNHLVNESSDEIIFSIVDPNNRIKDKKMEGFRFIGIDERRNFAAGFTDLHEAVIELLAKDISQSDFGSHVSNMPSEVTGEDITALMDRLEQILQVVSMNHQELARFHKSSNLREFLLKLSDKAGVSVDAPLENRIRFGSIIGGAIERNDQRTLQDYINQVLFRRT